MLEIDVIMKEEYDEMALKFVKTSFRVNLEHSLFSVSKWESVWEESFLSNKEKTTEQTISYVKLMILDEELPPEVFQKLIDNHIQEIQSYIGAAMSATKLRVDPNAPQSREIVTSELIYYWMISLNIPVQFEHWHFNRLITLIRVFNLKNSPKKKMSMNERRALNRQRQAKYKTRG